MLYTSVKFLIFILAVFLLYFIFPKKLRWLVLLAGSLFFYAGVGWKAFCFIAFSSITTYLTGLGAGALFKREEAARQNKQAAVKKYRRAKKLVVAVGILLNLGVLAYMKYYNFLAENLNALFSVFSFDLSLPLRTLLLPLGLSFYTFQVIGYLIDVSRGETAPERNPAKYCLFVTFFPQIIQGPIGRFDALAHQLYEGHEFKWDRVYDGMLLIMWGFFKKMVIADRAAIFVNTVFQNWSMFSGVQTFMGLFIYGIQLYADFSGGIDISRGIAQVMGIDMAQNFNHPFFAKSIAEYWNRWHMSLGSWMKDYVFYSMPAVRFISKTSKKTMKWFGKKVGKNLPGALVTLFCFLLIGIWHDASWNYVVFGLTNGLLVGGNTVLRPFYKKWSDALHIDRSTDAWNLFRMVRTFLICMVCRVSHSGSLGASLGMVGSLFTRIRFSVLFDGSLLTDYGLDRADYHILFFACVIFFCLSLVSEKGLDVRAWIRKQGFVVRMIVPLFLVFMTIMFAVLENDLVGGFLYAQF